jgi:hypothetical protein
MKLIKFFFDAFISMTILIKFDEKQRKRRQIFLNYSKPKYL